MMPTIFARQYMRKLERVSTTERVLGVLILLSLAGLAVLFVVQTATDSDYLFDVDESALRGDAKSRVPARSRGLSDAENPFPHPGIVEWQRPEKISTFSPENLYLKINGRADAYFKFNVAGLVFGTYRHAAEPNSAFDVYWYDMGDPDSAAGMYRSEAPPDVESVEIGREGYQVGGAVYFWAGSSYIQVMPTRFDAVDSGAALKIATQLAKRAAGS